jgi:pimeloyl-ACP methyl ester carboxylesterase
LIDWEPWVEQLIPTYRVIRFDLAGHGLTSSDPENNYSLERTLYLFEKLMDYLSVDKMALAGASIGGTISLHYAERHPDQVKQLILVSPGATKSKGQRKIRASKPPLLYGHNHTHHSKETCGRVVEFWVWRSIKDH